jgi:hypothetical protein
MPLQELEKVYDTLSGTEFSSQDRQGSLSSYNVAIYDNLANVQIKNWLHEAQERESTPAPSEEPVDNIKAGLILEKKLLDYVSANFKETEEQRKYRLQLLFGKIEKVQTILTERNGEVNFYASIYQTPPDVLYTTLDSKSVNSLVSEFESHFILH